MQKVGLLPFADAVGARIPAIMVANATVPGLTSQPASISSSVITGVLRNRLGYRGLVLTDSLSAAALTDIGYSLPRATIAALGAGADMILYQADAASVAAETAGNGSWTRCPTCSTSRGSTCARPAEGAASSRARGRSRFRG